MARFEEVIAEIERLTLQTTETEPLELFVELGRIQKQPSSWKFGGMAFGAVGAIVAFFVFGNSLENLPPFSSGGGAFLYSCFIGLALFFVVALIGRRAMDARVQQWLQRAERVIQARNGVKA